MTVFRMPSLGADMEDGTLIEWLVSPGDRVNSGDVVAVVETHKGAIEIEIFDSGVVESLDVEEGVTVPVGNPLATVRSEGESTDTDGSDEPATDGGPAASGTSPAATDEASHTESMEPPRKTPTTEPEPAEPSPEPEEEPASQPPEPEAPASPTVAEKTPAPGEKAASPAARRRAAEAGLDLAGVSGSGPRGAVLLADVEEHLQSREQAPPGAEQAGAASEAEPPAGETKPRAGKPGLDMASMREAIAAAMSRSKREIPHYYLRHSIDLQAATDWLDERNADRAPDQRLLMGVLFMKATARAVARTPELNGHYENGRFRPADKANVGMAIAMRGGGLIAPAVHDAAGKSLDELMGDMRDLVARTRTGRLKNSEITGGTITISSMGDNGVESLYGVIYPPQVALLGFGTPMPQPRVVDGKVRPCMTVIATLAGDHRVSDGRRGARLLADIAKYLEEPEAL